MYDFNLKAFHSNWDILSLSYEIEIDSIIYIFYRIGIALMAQ